MTTALSAASQGGSAGCWRVDGPVGRSASDCPGLIGPVGRSNDCPGPTVLSGSSAYSSSGPSGPVGRSSDCPSPISPVGRSGIAPLVDQVRSP